MRYFVDTPVFGQVDFMCARVSDSGVQTKIPNGDWNNFNMPLDALLLLVDEGVLIEVDEDPFKEYDCPDDN